MLGISMSSWSGQPMADFTAGRAPMIALSPRSTEFLQ